MKEVLDLLFPAVLNMSLAAIPVILVVLLARFLLKRAPPRITRRFWSVNSTPVSSRII